MKQTYFGLTIYNENLVKEDDIKKLPFYEFWLESAKGSTYPMIDNEAYIYLYDWESFSRLFIKTGKHRCSNQYPELEEKELSYEEAKNNHLLKYRGAFTFGDNAEEEYNQHRLNKFDIMDYAGVIKSDIPDDIKIKDIKLNDKQYLEERFGITGEENEKK